MPKQSLNFEEMYKELLAFHRRFGHSNVPANWQENVQLGRWVASIRYRNKVDGLPPVQIARLSSIDFVWSPSDVAWNRMFNALAAFRKRTGHCNVPAQWQEDLHLANWVANQRHRRKMGSLPKNRVQRLNSLGFEWSIYGHAEKKKEKSAPVKSIKIPRQEERLYCVASGIYVQHDGSRELSAELRKYVHNHKGDFPPYIPLPNYPTQFHVGENPMIRGRKVAWSGKGRLPKAVLDHVRDNGVLPPYD